MKFRIAIWASAGFLVACFWAIYFLPTASGIIANQPGVLAVARFSCPVAFVSLRFGVGISIYWTLVANTITYALIGFLVEMVRHRGHATA